MQDIWQQLRTWAVDRTPFALATVVEASRPSPRGIGSVLAVRADGNEFIGSVSAGCVESEVIEAAKQCLADGSVRWLTFGPDQGYPWEISLSCGGRIRVRVEPYAGLNAPGLSEKIRRQLDAQKRGLLVSFNGNHCLLDEEGTEIEGSSEIPRELVSLAQEHLKSGRETKEIEWEGSKALLRVFNFPKRLFVIGAAHIAIHLVGFAKALNYKTIVIDPREAYARADRFPVPPDQLICEWPNQALASFSIGPEDCVAAMTHDPKIDDDALTVFLHSDCGYIGALGSRKSHAARLKRLAKGAISVADLERINAPIGLDIGSETPAEIALSVMAEIVQRRNHVPR